MINVLDAAEGTPGPPLRQRMHQAFSDTGLFSSGSSFEFRPQQQLMAELVAEALEKSQPLVVEAATGVGKSLAYLLPAITHALERKKKAVVCTHTINLQEQLIHKDIPILRELIGDFKAEILKGRSNYLCPTRLKRSIAESGDLFTSTEAAELQALLEWSRETKDGTLSDINFSPSSKVWSLVCSESHACTPRRCHPGSGCFYQDIRRRMAEADVVVLNHTLFFTLLASAEEVAPDDRNFLFPNDFVILDEAHTIENIAAKAFGLHVTESNIRFELGRLYNPRSKKGFLPMLRDNEGIREVQMTLDAVEEFFRTIEGCCKFSQYGREYRVREPGLVENTLSLPLQRITKIN